MKIRTRFQEEQISATLRGEMAVMRLLGLNRNQHMQMAAGEISRQLGMTTSRIAAVLNSLEKKQLIVRRVDPKDRRRRDGLSDGRRHRLP